MIVIGLGAIIYSTKITDGAESSDIKSVVDGQDQMEQLRHKIEQFNEEITRKQEEKLEDTSEKMNTISNEKIMGISEYSDQVIDKIEKNHAEVVFLYDMLNEKQAEIQKLIHEADSSKVQFQDELAKSYQNVKDIVDPVEVSGKDAKKTGNEQSDSDLSEEDYDLQKLSDKERQAFDEEFSMQKEEKNVYAVSETDITWAFDCGWDDGESDHYQAPKTGLEDHILKDLLLAGTCLLVGGISVLLGMRKQKN